MGKGRVYHRVLEEAITVTLFFHEIIIFEGKSVYISISVIILLLDSSD